MEKNFDEDRAKSKENLDEAKALVDHQTHKVHKKNILCQEAIAKEVQKRKEVLQIVADFNQWVNDMSLELKVSFIFIFLHDLYDLQSSLTNVQSSLMKYSQEAKSAAKVVIKGKVKSDSVAEKQLRLLTDLKVNMSEVRDKLADEYNKRIGLEKMHKGCTICSLYQFLLAPKSGTTSGCVVPLFAVHSVVPQLYE